MFQFDIDAHSVKTIHFIGIGGVSMSGIAALLLDKGYTITGSDRERNHFVRRLEEKGATIAIGQKAENIQNPDLVVYTDAILLENEELIAAKRSGVPVITRGVMLGALMKNFPQSIAVSGTHGKSTTTSMIAEILLGANTDPTVLLGAISTGSAEISRSVRATIFLRKPVNTRAIFSIIFPGLRLSSMQIWIMWTSFTRRKISRTILSAI